MGKGFKVSEDEKPLPKSEIQAGGAAGGISSRGDPEGGDPGEIAIGVPLQPPITNRGVVLFTGCLDWITISFPGITGKTWVETRKALDWLQIEDKDAVFGHGYDMKACAGYGGIGQRVREGKIDGAVNLPGEAIRFMDAFGIDNATLLKRLRSVPGARLTRIDAAIDIFSERVKVPVWWEKVKAVQYTSRSRGKPRFAGDVDDVQTFYIGSPSSPRMLRTYNKTVEQYAKGITEPPANWTRVELQHRGEAAECASQIIAVDGLTVIPALIGGFFSLSDDAEWNEVVTGKIALGLPGRSVSTPEQKLRWLIAKNSGIAKIAQIAELCSLSDHFAKAMAGAEITASDIDRWVAAVHSGGFKKFG